ncbi:MAG TPA: DUF2892 domain-containing protein [Gammaproteobacteria bacterium]|nr:DUF2892 domain-containing protein [Gammaproteobacteria bacterium]
MNIDKWVFRVAGLFILASVVLAVWVSPWWLLFTAFVGANMLQASFTGFCPMASILARLGIQPGRAFECAPRQTGGSQTRHGA